MPFLLKLDGLGLTEVDFVFLGLALSLLRLVLLGRKGVVLVLLGLPPAFVIFELAISLVELVLLGRTE